VADEDIVNNREGGDKFGELKDKTIVFHSHVARAFSELEDTSRSPINICPSKAEQQAHDGEKGCFAAAEGRRGW